MKNIGLMLLGACVALSFSFKKKIKGFFVAEKAPVTYMDSVSYALGVFSGNNLKEIQDSVSSNQFYLGYNDQSKGVAKYDDNKIQEILKGLSAKIQKEMEKKAELENAELVEKHDAFMKASEGMAGVKKTSSGLLYKVIKGGMGANPNATDQVKVHYVGTLPDGTKFDSSRDRGEPATFGLNQVIKGWTEGLQLMSEGAIYEFYIPYNLAYGTQGSSGAIGPYQALKFEVELIEVKSK